MGNEMKRRYGAIGILLIFIGANVNLAAISEQIEGKAVITVDDELGDGDYTSIRDAISYAQPGDTIEVYSGTYQESDIHLGKRRLTLQGVPSELGSGNDTGKPEVISSAYETIFDVRTENITITGFVINDTVWPTVTYPVHIWGDNCTFSYNNLIGGWEPLWIGGDGTNPEQNPRYTRIIGNTIEGNTSAGIGYRGTFGNISGNTIRGCTNGAIIVNDQSRSTIISQNTIQDCGYGIHFINSSNSIISYNHISDARIGINLGAFGAKNISIEMNQIEDCGIGIYMEFSQSEIEIHRNNFMNNSVDLRMVKHLQFKDNYVFHRIVDENYYDSWRGSGSKFILGFTILAMIPLFMIENIFFIPVLMPRIYRDMNPAEEPYIIGG